MRLKRAGERPRRAERWSWPYFGLRNHLDDREVWHALVVPQRLSIRLVEAVRTPFDTLTANSSRTYYQTPSSRAPVTLEDLEAALRPLRPTAVLPVKATTMTMSPTRNTTISPRKQNALYSSQTQPKTFDFNRHNSSI